MTWTVECAAFLEKSVRETHSGKELGGPEENSLRHDDRNILEMLESVGTHAKSLQASQKSMKERVQSQINVVSLSLSGV